MLPNVNLLPTNVVRLPDAQCSMLPTLTQTVQHPSNSTHRISTRTSSSFNSNSNLPSNPDNSLPQDNSNNNLLLPNSSLVSSILSFLRTNSLLKTPNSLPQDNSNSSLLLPNSSLGNNLLHNSNNSLLLSSNNSLLLSHNSLP